ANDFPPVKRILSPPNARSARRNRTDLCVRLLCATQISKLVRWGRFDPATVRRHILGFYILKADGSIAVILYDNQNWKDSVFVGISLPKGGASELVRLVTLRRHRDLVIRLTGRITGDGSWIEPGLILVGC